MDASNVSQFISVKDWAAREGIPERTARNYCAARKIDGAFKVGKTWNIPADAGIPCRKTKDKH